MTSSQMNNYDCGQFGNESIITLKIKILISYKKIFDGTIYGQSSAGSFDDDCGAVNSFKKQHMCVF